MRGFILWWLSLFCFISSKTLITAFLNRSYEGKLTVTFMTMEFTEIKKQDNVLTDNEQSFFASHIFNLVWNEEIRNSFGFGDVGEKVKVFNRKNERLEYKVRQGEDEINWSRQLDTVVFPNKKSPHPKINNMIFNSNYFFFAILLHNQGHISSIEANLNLIFIILATGKPDPKAFPASTNSLFFYTEQMNTAYLTDDRENCRILEILKGHKIKNRNVPVRTFVDGKKTDLAADPDFDNKNYLVCGKTILTEIVGPIFDHRVVNVFVNGFDFLIFSDFENPDIFNLINPIAVTVVNFVPKIEDSPLSSTDAILESRKNFYQKLSEDCSQEVLQDLSKNRKIKLDYDFHKICHELFSLFEDDLSKVLDEYFSRPVLFLTSRKINF